MQINDHQHLTYCTNIHQGESWQEVKQYLEKYLPAIKAEISPDRPFGVGLRLSNKSCEELLEENHLDDFKKWLTANDLYVFTLNGFPYGGFHHIAVKDNVHKPDWTNQARVDYTRHLFTILSELLPQGMNGGISTSPISYKLWWGNGKANPEEALRKGTQNLLKVLKFLVELEHKTGKFMHLDIEPEPDGLIENTHEVIAFYTDWLVPAGVEYLQQHFGYNEEISRQKIMDHIQICYDVCHFAVGFEQPAEALTRLKAKGIKIGKVQISAALKALFPAEKEGKLQLLESFRQFNEPTYLHQVVGIDDQNKYWRFSDLPEALDSYDKVNFKEWRTHFHVPLFCRKYEWLESTQHDILTLFEIMKNEKLTDHLEIETYTWEVLPTALRSDITTSIIREFNWVLDNYDNIVRNE